MEDKYYIKKVQQICSNQNLKFISQVGQVGAASICFMVENPNNDKFVIKIPLYKDVLIRKQQTHAQVNEVLKNYNGELVIPVTTINEDYCIEQYCGEDIDLNSFNEEEKAVIAENVGKFLAYLHNQGKGEKCNYSIISDRLQSIKSMKIKYFQELPNKYQRYIEDLILEVKSFDKLDEIATWTHGDIRFQNILFNKENKKTAIIDFDRFGYGNIYEDFIPIAAASQGFDAQFLKIIINTHNQNCKYKINEQKFVAILKLAKLDEYARCAIAANKDAKQFLEVLQNRKFIQECSNLDDIFCETIVTL